MPRFSIIIPAYNAEKRIRKALDSIKEQTFRDFELIVVCDSCTDNTAQVAWTYGAKVIPVNYGNDGLSRSRGIDEAKGDWILFMDDDDWWLHEYVLWQLNEKLKEHNDSMDVLCFSFIFKGWGYAKPNGNRGNHFCAVWNKCWKRSSIGSTRFPNIPCSSDLHFHTEMFAKQLQIIDWDMPMYYYNYLRPGSISWQQKHGGFKK